MALPRTRPDNNDSGVAYQLHLMRHGIAVMRGSAGYLDDARRPLTPDGKKKMREIARGLRRQGLALDWVVTSPLVRAVETAEVLVDSLGASIPMDFCEALRPGGSAEALLSFLGKHPERKIVLGVGHEPDLSLLAARLIGAGHQARLGFKKGGCCLISFDEFPPKSPGELVWWLTPRLLRKLA